MKCCSEFRWKGGKGWFFFFIIYLFLLIDWLIDCAGGGDGGFGVFVQIIKHFRHFFFSNIHNIQHTYIHTHFFFPPTFLSPDIYVSLIKEIFSLFLYIKKNTTPLCRAFLFHINIYIYTLFLWGIQFRGDISLHNRPPPPHEYSTPTSPLLTLFFFFVWGGGGSSLSLSFFWSFPI